MKYEKWIVSAAALSIACASGEPAPATPTSDPQPKTADPAPAQSASPPEPAVAASADPPQEAPQPLAPAYSVFVFHTIRDFPSFKAYLDKNEEFRRKLGATAHVLSLPEGASDQAIVHYVVQDPDRVKKLIESPEIATLARQPGSPEDSRVIFAKDVAYKRAMEWPAESYTVLYKFEVTDFDTWKAKFDQNQPWRERVGIIGYGLHREIGESNTVIVHFVAESLDTIREMATLPEIVEAMKASGVTGSPKPVFAKNVELRRY